MPKTVKSWWWIALALVLVGSATLGYHAPPARAQSPRVTVEFWHGLAMPLGGILEKIVVDFNESQTQYQVNPTFKGSYPETMVAAIAAFRAGNAPHVVQMFEVGTATMMSARGAIKPVHELMKESGVVFDPDRVPALGGRLLQPARRTDDGDAVQQLDDDHVLQQGRLQEGGARPEQAAPDLGRAAGRGPEDPRGQRGAVRLHHRVADVGAVRAVQRDPQRAARHQGQRPRRARRGAPDQQPAARAPRADPHRHAEGGQLQVRRTRRGGRRAVPLRGVRDHPRLVRPARPHRARGQVRVGRGHAAVLPRARRTRPRTRSSAAPPSG